MLSFRSTSRLLLAGAGLATSSAFAPPRASTATPCSALRASANSALRANADDEERRFDVLGELADMLSSFDDVVDDFLNKRVSDDSIASHVMAFMLRTKNHAEIRSLRI